MRDERNGQSDPVVTARLSASNWIALVGLVAGLAGTAFLGWLDHDRKLTRLEAQNAYLVQLVARDTDQARKAVMP